MRPLSPHSAYLAAYLAEENTTDISQRTTIINDLRTPWGQRKLEAEYPQSDFKRSGGPKDPAAYTEQDVKRHVDQYQASRNLASGSSMQSAPPPTELEAPRRSVSPDSRTYLSKVSLEAFRRDNTPKMLNDLNSMRAQRGLHNDYTLDDLKPVVAGRLRNEKYAYEAAQRLRALDQGESRSGFSGPALPSGSTVSSAPYQVPSLSSQSGATSEGQPPRRRGATDAQITAHLHNDDGSLRTRRGVASVLHAAGLGADITRIDAQLQAAGGARLRPGATDAQIDAHLHNDDGSLRTRSDVASDLHAAGLGAGVARITARLQAARGPQ